MNENINSYINSLFDFVRIVDPISNNVINQVYEDDAKNIKCYEMWCNKNLCKNCIGARAYNYEDKSFVKIEYSGKSIYLVMAQVIKYKEKKYILEAIKDVTKTNILEDITKMTNEQMQEKVDKMNMLVALDALTECFNRRYIIEKLPIEISKAKKNNKDLSVMMMDVDFFKEINDKYGHLAGDYVLKKVVNVIKKNIRSSTDWIARYGGEEFIIVLNNTDSSSAFLLAERIRLSIENTIFKYKDDNISVTVSIGVTAMSDKINDKDQLLERVDENLYKAKSMGRNICILDGDALTYK